MEFREHLARSLAAERNRSKDIGIRPHLPRSRATTTSRNEQTSDSLDLSAGCATSTRPLTSAPDPLPSLFDPFAEETSKNQTTLAPILERRRIDRVQSYTRARDYVRARATKHAHLGATAKAT